MISKVITPFKCSQCGTEFSEMDGGICYFCHEVFYQAHLLIVFAGKKDIKHVCLSCKVKYIDVKIEKEN
ncbi:MAG: hypothetical protein MUP17_04045 [candidate division Zixibacteria bacterium]|nr:hypothetical protein [candidate division Zixibacteria bacterium]